jgi:hypothetical protein
VIGQLSRLKFEMQTDKPLTAITDGGADAELWNRSLEAAGAPSWWKGAWLWAECYLYRRIAAAQRASVLLANFDPFERQKQDSWLHSRSAVASLAQFLVGTACGVGSEPQHRHTTFAQLLQFSLWGNKMDLSLKPDLNQELFRQQQLQDEAAGSDKENEKKKKREGKKERKRKEKRKKKMME